MASFKHKQAVGAATALTVLVVGYLAFSYAQQGDNQREQGEKQPAKCDYKFSGPFEHENLTIFLIHGEDQFKDKSFLTLDEALEQKKFVIHETQSVNQLSMENLSDKEVLILAGDILKGGQQ